MNIGSIYILITNSENYRSNDRKLNHHVVLLLSYIVFVTIPVHYKNSVSGTHVVAKLFQTMNLPVHHYDTMKTV